MFVPLDVDYEFVFVNDASTDRSREILEEHSRTDRHIRLINMANRFGVNPCFVAGMRYAQGDAVVTMDCDLQDPPELIPEMIARWRDGADVVYTTRTVRDGEPAFKMFVTRWAYRVLHLLSGKTLPVDAGMFKLMDRCVVDNLLRVEEPDPYLRGLISWVGFRQEAVECRREARYAGDSHFPLLSRGPVSEFVAGLVSFSHWPLAAVLLVGMVAVGVSFLGLLATAVLAVTGSAVEPLTIAIVVLTFLCSVQIVCIGILGLYIGRIHAQTRSRPMYIVESTSGVPVEGAPEPVHEVLDELRQSAPSRSYEG